MAGTTPMVWLRKRQLVAINVGGQQYSPPVSEIGTSSKGGIDDWCNWRVHGRHPAGVRSSVGVVVQVGVGAVRTHPHSKLAVLTAQAATGSVLPVAD
jgi:hypothetical protein